MINRKLRKVWHGFDLDFRWFLDQPRPVNGVFAALSLMTAGCGIAHGTFYLPTRCLRWAYLHWLAYALHRDAYSTAILLQSLPTGPIFRQCLRKPTQSCAHQQKCQLEHYSRHTLMSLSCVSNEACDKTTSLTSCGFFFLTDGGCGCGCARPERERRARPRHDLGVSRCGDRVFGSGKGLKVLVFKKEMRKQICKIEAQDIKLIGWDMVTCDAKQNCMIIWVVSVASPVLCTSQLYYFHKLSCLFFCFLHPRTPSMVNAPNEAPANCMLVPRPAMPRPRKQIRNGNRWNSEMWL